MNAILTTYDIDLINHAAQKSRLAIMDVADLHKNPSVVIMGASVAVFAAAMAVALKNQPKEVRSRLLNDQFKLTYKHIFDLIKDTIDDQEPPI